MRTNKFFVSHKHCMQVFWRDIMSCWQKKILQKYWEGHMPVAMFYSTVISYYFYFFFHVRHTNLSQVVKTIIPMRNNRKTRPSRMMVIYKLLAEFVHFQNQNIRIYAKIQYARYDNKETTKLLCLLTSFCTWLQVICEPNKEICVSWIVTKTSEEILEVIQAERFLVGTYSCWAGSVPKSCPQETV